MDVFINTESMLRERLALDHKGAVLREQIEEAIKGIPNKRRPLLGRWRAGDRDCIIGTLDFTQRLYAEDAREDESPAWNHVARAVHRLAVSWGVRDATVLIAEGLHDIVEDHAEVLARLGKHPGEDTHDRAVKTVKRLFGHAVGNLVDLVSKRKSAEGLSPETKIANYVSYAQKICRDPAGILMKSADVCDNVFTPRSGDGGDYSMRKYDAVLHVLIEGAKRNERTIVKRWGEGVYKGLMRDLAEAERQTKIFLENIS